MAVICYFLRLITLKCRATTPMGSEAALNEVPPIFPMSSGGRSSQTPESWDLCILTGQKFFTFSKNIANCKTQSRMHKGTNPLLISVVNYKNQICFTVKFFRWKTR